MECGRRIEEEEDRKRSRLAGRRASSLLLHLPATIPCFFHVIQTTDEGKERRTLLNNGRLLPFCIKRVALSKLDWWKSSDFYSILHMTLQQIYRVRPRYSQIMISKSLQIQKMVEPFQDGNCFIHVSFLNNHTLQVLAERCHILLVGTFITFGEFANPCIHSISQFRDCA